MDRNEAVQMGIRDVRVWWNVEGTERRVYVHMWDGRDGCKYLTGNRWAARNSKDGTLTDAEWQAAWVLAQRTNAAGNLKWSDYRAANRAPAAVAAPEALRAASATQQHVISEEPEEPEERPVVATFTNWRRPQYQVGDPIVDETDRNHPHTLIVQRIRYLPADETNERDDPTWFIECVEPTATERESSAWQRAQAAADQRVAAAESSYMLMMMNTNGYGH